MVTAYKKIVCIVMLSQVAMVCHAAALSQITKSSKAVAARCGLGRDEHNGDMYDYNLFRTVRAIQSAVDGLKLREAKLAYDNAYAEGAATRIGLFMNSEGKDLYTPWGVIELLGDDADQEKFDLMKLLFVLRSVTYVRVIEESGLQKRTKIFSIKAFNGQPLPPYELFPLEQYSSEKADECIAVRQNIWRAFVETYEEYEAVKIE